MAKRKQIKDNVFFFFSILKIECEIVDEQLEKLEQIASLPMSSAESVTIKPLIATMENLLREWISADKDAKGETYALKKMMVQIFPYFHTHHGVLNQSNITQFNCFFF